MTAARAETSCCCLLSRSDGSSGSAVQSGLRLSSEAASSASRVVAIGVPNCGSTDSTKETVSPIVKPASSAAATATVPPTVASHSILPSPRFSLKDLMLPMYGDSPPSAMHVFAAWLRRNAVVNDVGASWWQHWMRGFSPPSP
eukprot:CAMPEP_0172908906 /NCGR_PEP_ID=MMETSP1075-20121228/181649_1 /TAXON_ID=2916 /ORGANISM="Ceratium fusus, Strain PA161109" /LENGTH=142 /DNA_ID=CAMNT_0013766763 /DNA_START=126 /DNA_END=551 /DNA_ORIENTATION=-